MLYSKNKPLRYGLYGEDDLLVPDFVHCESFEYRSAKHNWVIEPHLHAHLFQVFLIESGTVNFTFEGEPHRVSAQSIVAIPENIMHGLEVSRDIRGMVLTLSSSFMEVLFQPYPHVLTELGSTLVLTEVGQHKLFQLVRQTIYGLYEELQDDLPEKGMVLQSYFHLLLGGIYRLTLEKSEKSVSADSRSAQYFRNFLRSMKQSYSPRKTIKEYARELHITPVHLNRACQAMVGKSALRVVHDYFFLEAKKYLQHTEYSISEVAYRLNFEDPAYFSRFFSKQSGVSPRQFRELTEK
ncbi:helix-turn-helix domain-containing protein [Telluribacter sp. SYSU D00476]|uniref:helix-turn-helix domain-containing protein n=1 Tax=Telluribacter sp. SYSU D00476 TaxID=2811430 RepID=UPI001FF6DDD8|nr:helix-turn-helix domain-containing protein [Telluribacter sp. SYSU D00476]